MSYWNCIIRTALSERHCQLRSRLETFRGIHKLVNQHWITHATPYIYIPWRAEYSTSLATTSIPQTITINMDHCTELFLSLEILVIVSIWQVESEQIWTWYHNIYQDRVENSMTISRNSIVLGNPLLRIMSIRTCEYCMTKQFKCNLNRSCWNLQTLRSQIC